ncbi:MAG: aminodeoxychorismate/anthranilate synthase component I, partial [Proteobacteria bacterium]|nr:aminodeoxychorismate/anthranilate synthase component I [Pseudomonadota bacterium]
MTDRPYALSIPYREPSGAFGAFAGDPVAALLDGAADAGGRGRHAYIAADPFRVIGSGDETTIDGAPVAGDPFEVLGRELKKFRVQNDPGLPPFQTGAVGYLGYELGRHLERLPKPRDMGLDVPDMVVGLYDTICAFDTQTERAWIVACDAGAGDGSLSRPPPAARAEAMAARIAAQPAPGAID